MDYCAFGYTQDVSFQKCEGGAKMMRCTDAGHRECTDV